MKEETPAHLVAIIFWRRSGSLSTEAFKNNKNKVWRSSSLTTFHSFLTTLPIKALFDRKGLKRRIFWRKQKRDADVLDSVRFGHVSEQMKKHGRHRNSSSHQKSQDVFTFVKNMLVVKEPRTGSGGNAAQVKLDLWGFGKFVDLFRNLTHLFLFLFYLFQSWKCFLTFVIIYFAAFY